MKILNLYAGIGGNRKLWGNEHEITAVENNQEIANIYKDYFPDDIVIITDAHQYLLDHYNEYDFIWSSPPCPTHSRIRKNFVIRGGKIQNKPVYPNMVLYQEILFLDGYFQGKYCVENVISWYEPLIRPHEANSHYFWTNFKIHNMPKLKRGHDGGIIELQKIKGFDLSKYNNIDKVKILRNCVHPKTGLYILNRALEIKTQEDVKQPKLFQ